MDSIPQEQQMMMQQDPNMQKQIQDQIASRAAEIAAEVSEQYAQSLTPSPQEDPLVTIRKQELALKGQEIQQKDEQFKKKQEMEMNKERNNVLLDQQRLDQQEEIAQDRIETQRDIAAMNAMGRKN
jgi:phosphatidate phosphatase PAH1